MNARGHQNFVKSPTRQFIGDSYLEINKVDHDALMHGDEHDSGRGDVSFGGKPTCSDFN
jgi:hypothetical protein